jgi:sec-independent protein translocase protein TatC
MPEIVEKEMSFLDHLEELRGHLVRAVLSILIFSVVAFVSKYIVFHVIILGPARTDFITYRWLCQLAAYLETPVLCIDKLPFVLQNRTMTGQFTMHITSSVVVGLICAFPYVFWEIWRFVKPGLHLHEQNTSRYATFFVSALFLSGVLFGYYLVAPLSINFLANYQLDESILNEFDVVSYISTLITIVLACGVMFQLPVVVFFLTTIGLITPQFMKDHVRHAIIIILIISAVITPPDVFSQILVAFPVFVLYLLSIFISAAVVRKQKKAEAEDDKQYNTKPTTLTIQTPDKAVRRE